MVSCVRVRPCAWKNFGIRFLTPVRTTNVTMASSDCRRRAFPAGLVGSPPSKPARRRRQATSTRNIFARTTRRETLVDVLGNMLNDVHKLLLSIQRMEQQQHGGLHVRAPRRADSGRDAAAAARAVAAAARRRPCRRRGCCNMSFMSVICSSSCNSNMLFMLFNFGAHSQAACTQPGSMHTANQPSTQPRVARAAGERGPARYVRGVLSATCVMNNRRRLTRL